MCGEREGKERESGETEEKERKKGRNEKKKRRNNPQRMINLPMFWS